MAETKTAAGLVWTQDGEAWNAADGRGRFQVIEYAPGIWTEFFWPEEESCGCGAAIQGGGEFATFEEAARAAAGRAGG